MRLRKKKHSNAIEMDLTPMIDIVFLLIIFFITVTQITKINHENIPLPKVQFSEDQTDTRVVVNIKRNGEYIVDGEGKTLDQVVYYLARQIELKNNDSAKVRVTIRIDHRSEAGFTNSLIREIKNLGIVAVQFGVEGKK